MEAVSINLWTGPQLHEVLMSVKQQHNCFKGRKPNDRPEDVPDAFPEAAMHG